MLGVVQDRDGLIQGLECIQEGRNRTVPMSLNTTTLFRSWNQGQDGGALKVPDRYHDDFYAVQLFTQYMKSALGNSPVERFPDAEDHGKIGGPEGNWGTGSRQRSPSTRDREYSYAPQQRSQRQNSEQGQSGSGSGSGSGEGAGGGSENDSGSDTGEGGNEGSTQGNSGAESSQQ